jgi:alpha-L-fucosidase
MKATAACLILLAAISACTAKYEPNWKSLDARPLPKWYDEAKFGIFIHWGLFSVPSYGCNGGGASGEWYWWVLNGAKTPCLVDWHQKTYGKDFRYEDFAPMWKTSMFNPDDWAQLFKKSGAKYIVLTSKHHEGFCNWPSAQSWNWNSVDAGPHQDNVKLVTDAVRKAGLRMGLYHSLFEWFNPLYLTDRNNKGNTTYYVDTILHPQLKDVVMNYKPEVIWSDGDWEMPDSYWRSQEFLAWLYNDSPVKDTVVVNDRWGSGDACTHGGYYTCDDRYNPGILQPHKWENCLTIDEHSWGYRRNAEYSDMMTIEELISQLASTVACGGNMLLNVGPTAEGMIIPMFQERLLQIGAWLDINGASIYKTTPWRSQNDTAANVWYTQNGATVNAIVLSWPKNNQLFLTQPLPTSTTTATMLGYGKVNWSQNSRGSITVTFPTLAVNQLPNPYAWVIQLNNVK